MSGDAASTRIPTKTFMPVASSTVLNRGWASDVADLARSAAEREQRERRQGERKKLMAEAKR